VSDQTPSQKASGELAEAVFSDPDLRERLEMMAKETATREPVPDDFAWLPNLSADERMKIEATPEDALKALLRPKPVK
jgi:hypothetical protein